MKTNKFVITITGLGFFTGAMFSLCQTKEQKVEKAEENVIDAKADLKKAQQEYREEAEKNG